MGLNFQKIAFAGITPTKTAGWQKCVWLNSISSLALPCARRIVPEYPPIPLAEKGNRRDAYV
jgi:hypothetical protein